MALWRGFANPILISFFPNMLQVLLHKNISFCHENLVFMYLGSESTRFSLKLMRFITLSWLDTTIAPLKRIYMMWYATFGLRKWRYHLSSSATYNVNINFISANSYLSAEICAHSLILIIVQLDKMKKPELFLPWLFSSQCCEEFFRAARSCSTFQSTQCNFTCKDFLTSNCRKLDALLRLNTDAQKRGLKLPRQSRPFDYNKE
jgi:hypothetical protein